MRPPHTQLAPHFHLISGDQRTESSLALQGAGGVIGTFDADPRPYRDDVDYYVAIVSLHPAASLERVMEIEPLSPGTTLGAVGEPVNVFRLLIRWWF